mmetsp:Transcript_26343/g.70325  ORF Transcript_26343/g.70325 Transcript_26343/m.70325 type:complete len:283 (+) Transcript_26343:2982-3830(+)
MPLDGGRCQAHTHQRRADPDQLRRVQYEQRDRVGRGQSLWLRVRLERIPAAGPAGEPLRLDRLRLLAPYLSIGHQEVQRRPGAEQRVQLVLRDSEHDLYGDQRHLHPLLSLRVDGADRFERDQGHTQTAARGVEHDRSGRDHHGQPGRVGLPLRLGLQRQCCHAHLRRGQVHLRARQLAHANGERCWARRVSVDLGDRPRHEGGVRVRQQRPLQRPNRLLRLLHRLHHLKCGRELWLSRRLRLRGDTLAGRGLRACPRLLRPQLRRRRLGGSRGVRTAGCFM